MLTPFSSGVTPTASLKTNSSDQRMSPAFAGAQPLADGQTPAAALQPTIGLEPEALLANVKTETATALNQTVLQTLATAVAARMGVDRLPDELLEAFFIRLAAAIERKPLIEQGKIEARAGLKALQIPLSDLAPALRDPSGPVAARLTARVEAPMAAPQKTAAAGITDSYLQTGSTPARSAETVAMGERNKLSIDSGNLLFQSTAPKSGEIEADNASQTQFRTLFAPDAAGFERTASNEDMIRNDTVARRGAGPAANGLEGPLVVGPEIPDDAADGVSPAARSAAPGTDGADGLDAPAKAEAASTAKPTAAAAQPGLQARLPSEDQPAFARLPDSLAAGSAKQTVGPQKSDAVQSNERVRLPATPPLDPLAEFGEKAEDADLQRKLFRMLTPAPSASEDGSALTTDLQQALKGRNPANLKDIASLADSTEAFDAASERSSRSRDVIGSTLLPSSTTSQADVAQRAAAAPHLGVPFGYVTTPPLTDAFEAETAEDSGRRSGDENSNGEDAEEDPETPDQRRERLAREAVDRLLQPEPEQAPALNVNRDSTEADRAFAYYQRLAGF
ncbi:hypothetical protein [Rhizobium sp. FKL33]|uniref:hypothetical protein n=1 Tax=Rhizobium sp. FKL33 TaxID=2562307 RepID=UPI0010C11E00|nr:hypothetical protein [Rhizobium sp. FKL33]